MRLAELSLEGNPLGDVGAERLVAALRSTEHPSLEVLNLQNCAIGDAGADALAGLLVSDSCCLAELLLSENRLTTIVPFIAALDLIDLVTSTLRVLQLPEKLELQRPEGLEREKRKVLFFS